MEKLFHLWASFYHNSHSRVATNTINRHLLWSFFWTGLEGKDDDDEETISAN